jgi:hypothetical protein
MHLTWQKGLMASCHKPTREILLSTGAKQIQEHLPGTGLITFQPSRNELFIPGQRM